jgi:hypothetical protein
LADIFGVLQHEVNRVGTPESSREASVQMLRDRVFPRPSRKRSASLMTMVRRQPMGTGFPRGSVRLLAS